MKTKVSEQYAHTLLECIKNDHNIIVTQQQKEELWYIANNCIDYRTL